MTGLNNRLLLLRQNLICVLLVITQDHNRYSYVVAALKDQVMGRVIDIIRNPPASGTHKQAIKDCLFPHLAGLP